jgi:Flp pilus assembly protein TadD
MRIKIISIASLLVALAGCASMPKSDPTIEQQGETKWNNARESVLLNLARDQYSNGQYDQCHGTLIQAMQMNNADPQLHLLAGRVSIEQGQLDIAQQELDKARTLDPKNAEPDYYSGVICQRWQQPQKALAYYDSACKKAPTEEAYLTAKAETLVALGRSDEALALLQSQLDYFEHSSVIRDAVGMLLLQKHKPDQAVDMFRQASILATDDLGIREHLAFALVQDQQYADAEQELNRLIQDPALSKRADLYDMLAECQLNTNQLAEARSNARTACTLEESSADAALTLAKISLQLNDTRQTELSINRALDLAPDNAQAHLLLGYLRLRQSRLGEALDSFQQSAKLDKSDTTPLCMIGVVLEKMHRPSEAARYYTEALKINPSDDMASQLLAAVDQRQ